MPIVNAKSVFARRVFLVVICLVLLLNSIATVPHEAQAASTTATFAIAGTRDYVEAFSVLSIVNQKRSEKGLKPVKMDKSMLEAAMQRAAECQVYYSHVRPNGKDCFSAFMDGNTTAGENIAAGHSTASRVMNGWMNSDGHRKNIENSNFTTIGIGCFYQGSTKYWVQVFGDKAATVASQPKNAYVLAPVEVLKSSYTLKCSEQVAKGSTRYSMDITTPGTWPKGAYVKVDSSAIAFSTSDTRIAMLDNAGVLKKGQIGGKVTLSLALKNDPEVLVSKEVLVEEPSLEDSLSGVSTKSLAGVKIASIPNMLYTGSKITPTLKITDGTRTLSKGTDYLLKYINNIAIGVARIVVTGKGNYTGTRTATFRILPSKGSIKKLTTPKKGKVKVTWKTMLGASGYQVQSALNSKFTKNKKTRTVAKGTASSVTLTSLHSKKYTYVRMRAYVVLGGTKVFGSWSVAKKIKVK